MDRLLKEASTERAVNYTDAMAIGTSIGSVRKENQDRALVLEFQDSEKPWTDFHLAIVCDGLGGMKLGGEAAALAIRSFAVSFLLNVSHVMKSRLEEAANDADAAVYDFLHGSGGATLVAACIQGSQAYVVHAGDSRAYLLNDRRLVTQLTTDDNLRKALGGDAKLSSHHGDRLIQFIGLGEGLIPHIREVSLGKGSQFLLTSDGVHGVLSNMISQTLMASDTIRDFVRRLIVVAEQLGGLDNATALVVGSRKPTGTSAERGVSIRLWSANRDLEIILPADGFQEQPSLIDRKPKKIATETRKSQRKARTRTRKRSNRTDQPPELPLDGSGDEAVNVEFPERDEN